MEPTRSIDCECELMNRPVNAFGDFVCKPSTSSVRDMIRRFEDGETPDRSNLVSTTSTQSTQSTNNRTPEKYASQKNIQKCVYEEQVLAPQRAVQMTVKEYFAKQSGIRSRDKISEKRSFFENNIVKSNSQQRPQGSFTGRNPFVKETDSMTYPSKTTICKTDFGVRIIVDINFDTRSKLENWLGSRIETDLPSSEILTEFQKKVF